MIINSPQALQQLQQMLPTLDDKQLKSIQIHVEGRLAFPKIDQPQGRKNDATARKTYGGVVFFPMGNLSPLNQVGMNAIHQISQRFKAIFHPNVPENNYKYCYKNFQVSPTQESGEPHPEFYKDSWWINTSSGEKFKPKVFKKVGGVIQQVDNADADVYQGQEVILVLTLYPIGTDPKNKESKKGVSANMEGILIKGGGERIGGGTRAEIDPNASFGSFANSIANFDQGSTNPFSPGTQAQVNSNPFGAGAPVGNEPVQNAGNPFGQNTQSQNAAQPASPFNNQANANPFANSLV